MDPEILPVDADLRSGRFGGDEDVDLAWPWYRDVETVTLVDRARALGWGELRVREAYTGNDASHRLFSGLGFVAVPGDAPPAYVLKLAPLGGRPR